MLDWFGPVIILEPDDNHVYYSRGIFAECVFRLSMIR
jgi:hypothetical protein